LSARYGARLVLTGGPDERHLTQAVRDAMGVPALDLTGRTDLGTFAALIARLDLLVTNDTGASHLAAAARTRSVVLFGPSRPERWAPLAATLHTALDAAALSGAPVDCQTALAALPVHLVLAACGGALNHARTVHPAPVGAPKEAAWRA
jgi:ADP-heptose:LPS heptosyltransferase